jgi:hypothetical protein
MTTQGTTYREYNLPPRSLRPSNLARVQARLDQVEAKVAETVKDDADWAQDFIDDAIGNAWNDVRRSPSPPEGEKP